MGTRDIIRYIERVVNEGKLEDGRILVDEYKKNFGNDAEIASIEGTINFYEGKYEEALLVVKEGLKCNLLESDLYSIMGSIYEAKKEYNRAYLCYEQALYLCIDNEKKNYIIEDINNLNNNYNISVNKVNSSVVSTVSFNKLNILSSSTS